MERAISKSKSLFALLMVESNASERVKHMHPLARSLLREFEHVFPNGLSLGIPPLRGIEHQIDLLPSAPLSNKLTYRCNPNETKERQRQVQELPDCGYIRKSPSSCSVPALLVPKKDGTWRICVNYRSIKNITIKYQFLFFN